jgi:hypothetical protein
MERLVCRCLQTSSIGQYDSVSQLTHANVLASVIAVGPDLATRRDTALLKEV